MAKGLNSYIRKADEIFIKSIQICMYCGCSESLHIDHIIPPRIGGNSERNNLTRACKRCNSIKSDATLDMFLERIIKHRQESYKLGNRYVRSFKKHRRRKSRGWTEKDFQWTIDKINFHRSNHTYFTRVIYSLINRSYMIGGANG